VVEDGFGSRGEDLGEVEDVDVDVDVDVVVVVVVVWLAAVGLARSNPLPSTNRQAGRTQAVGFF
jgi:hypothetical protein